MKKTIALSLVVLVSLGGTAAAELIPNGDFETGDFSDWFPQTPLNASVEFIDGSFRAVLTSAVTIGPSSSSSELLTSSDPSSWGFGNTLRFDMAYTYATDSLGAVINLALNGGPGIAVDLFAIQQQDATPLAGMSPMTTYEIPWNPRGAIDITPTVVLPNSGSGSLIVVLDNFRIVPEPSAWALVVSAFFALTLIVRRRRLG